MNNLMISAIYIKEEFTNSLSFSSTFIFIGKFSGEHRRICYYTNIGLITSEVWSSHPVMIYLPQIFPVYICLRVSGLKVAPRSGIITFRASDNRSRKAKDICTIL